MSDRVLSPEIFTFRHRAKKNIRAHFDDQGFIEIDTPYLLRANTPDPHIDPIFARASGRDLQLHTSPEIWLKRALSLDLPKIYHMGRVFRDDPAGDHHCREFTMLEWYRAQAHPRDLLKDCQAIFHEAHFVARDLSLIPASDPPAFIHTTIDHLFEEHANLDLPKILLAISAGSLSVLQEVLAARGELLPVNASFIDAFFHIMIKYIEPNLPFDQPVVISKWPAQLAALAQTCADPLYCDRFEIYFRGLEIANAYRECVDPEVLRSRFNRENQERSRSNKPQFPVDEGFLAAMIDMPESCGIALGIDRLLMAVAKRKTISEIIFGCVDR